MNIAVFLSATLPSGNYEKHTIELGRLIAQNGHTLVYGGSEKGLMKTLADTVESNGGRIIGVTAKIFEKFCRNNLSQKFVLEDIPSRVKKMIEISDIVIGLPGGNGTLDEMTQAIEQRKSELVVNGNDKNIRNRMISFISTKGFWNHIKNHFEMLEKHGLLHVPMKKLVVFVGNPEEAIKIIG